MYDQSDSNHFNLWFLSEVMLCMLLGKFGLPVAKVVYPMSPIKYSLVCFQASRYVNVFSLLQSKRL